MANVARRDDCRESSIERNGHASYISGFSIPALSSRHLASCKYDISPVSADTTEL